jgi:hypothetical protein
LPSLGLLLGAAFMLAVGSSCSAPPADDPRFVLLESESFGCGAAEGLGCGLAIAPVLEQIDALPGVIESSVSWDGHTFRIELSPGADRDKVAAAVAAVLEGEATCVTSPRGSAGPAPAQWFNAAQTVQLSRHEAGVIAARLAENVEAEVALAPPAAEQLRTVLREELERAFERAHAQGGGVHRLHEQLPEAWPRFESRLTEFLTPEQVDSVSAIVGREVGG